MVNSVDLELVFPATQDCIQLRNQIDRLLTNKDYWAKNYNQSELKATSDFLDKKQKLFADNGCEKKVLDIQLQDTKNVADIYGLQDKGRIEAQNKQEVNNRKLMATIIILSSLIMIIVLKGKKD